MYAATKAAPVAFSAPAHKELSEDGVHVTALLPGLVDTPGAAWAKGAAREQRLLPPDVAGAVWFLVRMSPRCFVPEIMQTHVRARAARADWPARAELNGPPGY